MLVLLKTMKYKENVLLSFASSKNQYLVFASQIYVWSLIHSKLTKPKCLFILTQSLTTSSLPPYSSRSPKRSRRSRSKSRSRSRSRSRSKRKKRSRSRERTSRGSKRSRSRERRDNRRREREEREREDREEEEKAVEREKQGLPATKDKHMSGKHA